jgi:hypothetical protein
VSNSNTAGEYRWERNRSGTGEEAGGAALGDLSDSAESWGGAALGDAFGFKLGQSWFGRRLGVSAEALRCIELGAPLGTRSGTGEELGGLQATLGSGSVRAGVWH